MKGRRLTVEDLKNMDGKIIFVDCNKEVSFFEFNGLAKVDVSSQRLYYAQEHPIVGRISLFDFETLKNSGGKISKIYGLYEWIEEPSQEIKTIYLILDASGSSNNHTKDFYIKLHNKLNAECERVNIISHNTAAKFINIEDLKFEGGSYLSSGLSLAIGEVIRKNEPCKIIQLSDGDNWGEDDERFSNCLDTIKKLDISYEYYELFPQIYKKSMYDKYGDKMSVAHKLLTNDDISKILLKEDKVEMNNENKKENISENKQFTKSDLKTGMWVECRDKWTAIVLLNTPHGDTLIGDDGDFARLSEYLDDLTDGDNYKEYDIIKIYSPKSITSIKNGTNLNLIWQREEKPINTIEHEVIRTFTYENETITLAHKDNWTTVRLQDGTMAKSRCHPEDQFDRDKGLELAYYRAKKKQFENAIDRMIKAGL